MAASRPKPGNPERGWNDPPMFGFSANPGHQPGAPKRLLNKRVAFPATNLPAPGHAVLNPSNGPPVASSHDTSAGIPIPKVVHEYKVGNSALPPALQEVSTAVVDQGAPLSPVLLPPTADTSMPVTVPLLVPAIVDPVKLQSDQSQDPVIQEERLADLLSRLQLRDDGQLLSHVTAQFDTIMDRYCNLLTEKACEDIRRKLEMFEDKWKKRTLSEPVKVKITHLAIALLHEEVDKAYHLHLALMVDHIAEVNQWMMGVKRLIQQQQLFLKEKELSSGSKNTTGEENSAIDNKVGPDDKDKSCDDKETDEDLSDEGKQTVLDKDTAEINVEETREVNDKETPTKDNEGICDNLNVDNTINDNENKVPELLPEDNEENKVVKTEGACDNVDSDVDTKGADNEDTTNKTVEDDKSGCDSVDSALVGTDNAQGDCKETETKDGGEIQKENDDTGP